MLRFFSIILFVCFMSSFSIAEESKLNRIIATNTLKVCVWPEYYGISYLDQRTQKLVGIDSGLAQFVLASIRFPKG